MEQNLCGYYFFFPIEAAVVYVRDEAKRENQNFRIN